MQDIIWKCNFKHKHAGFFLITNMDIFWLQVLEAWAELNYVSDVSNGNVDTQILWGNSHINISSAPIYFDTCFHNGLIYLNQLFDQDGNFHTVQYLSDNYGLTQYQCIQL